MQIINIYTSFSQTSLLSISCGIEQHYFVQFFLPKLSFQKGLLDFQIDTKLTRGDMLLDNQLNVIFWQLTFIGGWVLFMEEQYWY